MKRMVVLLSVLALMVVMLLALAVPAFAQGKPPGAGPPPGVCEFLLFEKNVFPPACDRN